MNISAPFEDFYDLLESVCPDNGYAIMLKAYFDASQRPSGVFCVAGLAFEKRKVPSFDREWWEIFGDYGGCHMKELVHKKGRFKKITDEERDRLIKGAISIIKRRMSYGSVISCNISEMNSLLPTWIRGFEGAYPVCCHLAMAALGNKVQEYGGDRIAYFFESGDRYSGCAHEFMSRYTKNTPELKDSYQHYSHSFIQKEDALGLQAADVLAWEWAKFQDETIDQKKRKMRLSIIELLSKNGDFNHKIAGIHAEGEPLKKFFQKVWRLGLMQLEENAVSQRDSS